jgi:ribosomal-protein-alanine N-acetyltransferase
MKFEFEAFPVLETSRLHLRSLEKKNAEQVLFLRSNEEVTRYIERKRPSRLDEALEFIDKIQAEYKKKESVSWAIHLEDEPLMIGSICLWNFSADRKTAEVGYDLHPVQQNKGIMTEALRAVLHFGFERLSLDTIKAYTHHANESSKRLLIKNGFAIVAGEKDADNEDNVIFSIHKSKLLA